jgi:drug/metabolite transporter (DMT)-like permease
MRPRPSDARASADTFIIPVVSLLLALAIRHEQMSGISIVGALITGA